MNLQHQLLQLQNEFDLIQKDHDLNENVLNIPVDNLEDRISATLLRRFKTSDIETIEDILKTTVIDFAIKRNVGIGLAIQFNDLKKEIISHPEKFLNLEKKKIPERKIIIKKKKKFLVPLQKITDALYADRPVDQIILNEPIETFFRIIPGFLYYKLLAAELKTIGDVLKMSAYDFAETRNVGTKIALGFYEFKKEIINQPENFLAIINNKDPESPCFSILDYEPGQSFLQFFKNYASRYFNSKKNKNIRSFIFQYYGIDSEMFILEQIAKKNRLSRERIRQIISTNLFALKMLIKRQLLSIKHIDDSPESVPLIKTTIDQLCSAPFLTFDQIKEYFSKEFHENFDQEKEKILLFFLKTIGITEFKINETKFTKARLFNLKTAHRTKIINTLKAVRNILQNNNSPLSEEEIIYHLESNSEEINSFYVPLALKLLPKIEKVRNSNQECYKIKDKLKITFGDYAYQVLKEAGVKMHHTEIVAEVNAKFGNELKKPYTYQHFQLNIHKKITHIGLTGYWALSEWNLNTDTYSESLLKILRQFDRPCTAMEIRNEMKQIHPNLNENSFRTFISNLCLAVISKLGNQQFDKNIYILPEWQSRYPKLTIRLKKDWQLKFKLQNSKLAKEKLIEILKASPQQKMQAPNIIKIFIAENPDLAKTNIYSYFDDERYFKKTLVNSANLIIELK